MVPKCREGGVTIHIVTGSVDGGPIVLSDRYIIGEQLLSMGALRLVNSGMRKQLVPQALVKWHQGLDGSA
jgi:folate-dependent phosphoribosylglycinamide formyltransferase PurN